ncbi:MAG: MFS transporter, partial [Woeseiaceae bacterium]
IGASTGMVLARAIVRDVASGVDAARLMSLLVMILTVVPMLAPILGAFLAETLGWRSTLYALVVIGVVTLALIRSSLRETHSPSLEHRIGRQFWLSVREFFSHRQSVFGVVLIMLTAGGFMVLISGSASLILEIYKYPVKVFGVIFALCGIAMFVGSVINRRLLLRMSPLRASGIGALLVAGAGAQMLYIFWVGDVGFWWVWGNACLYMFGTGFLMPNAMALALEPVPKIAGMASSIIGTLQGVAQVTSVTIGSLLYDGTTANITLIMGGAGIAILAVYLLRGAIVGVEAGPAAKP